MLNYLLFDEADLVFVDIGDADLNNGERLFVDIDERPVVVFCIASNYYAIADICSHDDGALGDGLLDEYNVVCPRHGAEFDVRSGKAISMPAAVDIPAYPVKIVEGKILVGVPKE